MPDGLEFRSVAHRRSGATPALPDEGRLPSFDRATAWAVSKPLLPEDLAGRVVLVSFWTYTCVNWLRTLPYLRAWNAKYQVSGLTIVGVHTPEFGFERELQNVRKQVSELGIEFSVAVDSDYGVWDAFANRYWPAVYLADSTGRMRYHHFGEGEYAMTEMAIQALLVESGVLELDPGLVEPSAEGLEVAADWETLRSPESYLGYGQSSQFAADNRALYDRRHDYVHENRLSLNSWDLAGSWTVSRHAVIADEPGGRIAFRFHARDVNLVMALESRRGGVPFRVFLGGERVGSARGTDVDATGSGVLDDAKTYQLVRQNGPIVDQLFEIEFLDGGVGAYCFTFG